MVCPNCGGEIIVEQGRCESCGSYFTPELLKQISHGIKGSAYELTKGDLEKERMLKKADTHLSMGDFDAAIRSLIKMFHTNFPMTIADGPAR